MPFGPKWRLGGNEAKARKILERGRSKFWLPCQLDRDVAGLEITEDNWEDTLETRYSPVDSLSFVTQLEFAQEICRRQFFTGMVVKDDHETVMTDVDHPLRHTPLVWFNLENGAEDEDSGGDDNVKFTAPIGVESDIARQSTRPTHNFYMVEMADLASSCVCRILVTKNSYPSLQPYNPFKRGGPWYWDMRGYRGANGEWEHDRHYVLKAFRRFYGPTGYNATTCRVELVRDASTNQHEHWPAVHNYVISFVSQVQAEKERSPRVAIDAHRIPDMSKEEAFFMFLVWVMSPLGYINSVVRAPEATSGTDDVLEIEGATGRQSTGNHGQRLSEREHKALEAFNNVCTTKINWACSPEGFLPLESSLHIMDQALTEDLARKVAFNIMSAADCAQSGVFLQNLVILNKLLSDDSSSAMVKRILRYSDEDDLRAMMRRRMSRLVEGELHAKIPNVKKDVTELFGQLFVKYMEEMAK
ncbi:Hypp4113 [Branchiostoma lanceolatum]|uniref:Hypp4113 protein n=1 Tax=Branchiostoma lanceolatum TaxID=7740 RepID=A0A8K0A6R1_BRALA|nr:Hypp4113 [Branchiostoma lanceolatum]